MGRSYGSNEPEERPVAKQGSIATLERRLRDLKAQSRGKVKPVHQTREWRAAQAKRRAQWIKDHPGEEVPDALKPRVAVPCPKGTRPRCYHAIGAPPPPVVVLPPPQPLSVKRLVPKPPATEPPLKLRRHQNKEQEQPRQAVQQEQWMEMQHLHQQQRQQKEQLQWRQLQQQEQQQQQQLQQQLQQDQQMFQCRH